MMGDVTMQPVENGVRPSLLGRTLMCNHIDPWISSRYAHLTECHHNHVVDILHDIRSYNTIYYTRITKQYKRKASRSKNPQARRSAGDLSSNLHGQSPCHFHHILHLNEFNSKE